MAYQQASGVASQYQSNAAFHSGRSNIKTQLQHQGGGGSMKNLLSSYEPPSNRSAAVGSSYETSAASIGSHQEMSVYRPSVHDQRPTFQNQMQQQQQQQQQQQMQQPWQQQQQPRPGSAGSAAGNVHLQEIERKAAVRKAERQAAIAAEREDDLRVERESAALRREVEAEIASQRKREDVVAAREASLLSFMAQDKKPGPNSKSGNSSRGDDFARNSEQQQLDRGPPMNRQQEQQRPPVQGMNSPARQQRDYAQQQHLVGAQQQYNSNDEYQYQPQDYAQQQQEYALHQQQQQQQQQQQGHQYGLQQGQPYTRFEQEKFGLQKGSYEPPREQYSYSGASPQAAHRASFGEAGIGADALTALQSYNLQRQQEHRPVAFGHAAPPAPSYVPQAAPNGSPAGMHANSSPGGGGGRMMQQGYGVPPNAHSPYNNNGGHHGSGYGHGHGGSGHSCGSPSHGYQSPPPGSMDSRSSNVFANGTTQNSGNVITDRRTTRVVAPPGGFSSFKLG